MGAHGHKFDEIYEELEKLAVIKKEEFDKLDNQIMASGKYC